MSQSTKASDSASLKRTQNPAYVYGPMVYQFPPEDNSGKSQRNNDSFAVAVILTILIVGGVVFFLRERGVDLAPVIVRTMQNESAISARVATDILYLREGPGTEYVATYLLPYDWPLLILGEAQIDSDGEVWVKVRLETEQGTQQGWVNQRYIQTIT